jgi:hypothetical protein
MTTNIYDLHRAAFANVSAYVVTLDGKRVATVAIKFPRDGNRLWAYVHFIGLRMVRCYANGGGYDKCSAAVESAAETLHYSPGDETTYLNEVEALARFKAAIAGNDGQEWTRRLTDAGFCVFQAV